VITGTHWTVQQLEATDYAVVMDIVKHWEEWPPIHILARSFFGNEGGKKRRSTSRGRELTLDELKAIAGEFRPTP